MGPPYPIARSDGQKNLLQNRRRLRGHSDGCVAYCAFSSIICEGVTLQVEKKQSKSEQKCAEKYSAAKSVVKNFDSLLLNLLQKGLKLKYKLDLLRCSSNVLKPKCESGCSNNNSIIEVQCSISVPSFICSNQNNTTERKLRSECPTLVNSPFLQLSNADFGVNSLCFGERNTAIGYSSMLNYS